MLRSSRSSSWLGRLLIGSLLMLWGCGGEFELPGVDEDAPVQSAERTLLSAVVGRKARVVRTGGVGLRLRSGPSTRYAIRLVMPERAIVDVLGGPSHVWYKVKYRGRVGWSYGYYLTPYAKTTSSSSSSKAGHTSIGSRLNLLPYSYGRRYRITCGHGCYGHVGWSYWAWDFGVPEGTPVLAAHSGTVRGVKGWSRSGGCSSAYAAYANYVVVAKGDGTESLYLHLRSTVVRRGQRVARGQLLGYSGRTGWACGAHLHFQIQKSPVGGSGRSGYYNPSVHSYFYDTGKAHDPRVGERPLSRNGKASRSVSSVDAPDAAGDGSDTASDIDLHAGDDPGAFDQAMREAAAHDDSQAP